MERTRARLSARETPTDQWPLFEVHVSRTAERAVLHLAFDMLVVDHASLRVLLAEFQRGHAGEPLTEAPRITFRDYVLARRALTDTDARTPATAPTGPSGSTPCRPRPSCPSPKPGRRASATRGRRLTPLLRPSRGPSAGWRSC